MGALMKSQFGPFTCGNTITRAEVVIDIPLGLAR